LLKNIAKYFFVYKIFGKMNQTAKNIVIKVKNRFHMSSKEFEIFTPKKKEETINKQLVFNMKNLFEKTICVNQNNKIFLF
jgi:hypothetical protein